ncbi:NAD(P)H-dependent oxidoreductase [Algiphilus sp. W345]|uniref:NAD(P)H-dependent oxidoreductase n=1 Tax=Banduia mediterranea TaxID=3075609 RepID=A0ABU2WGP6_9GAMM|nr:NAD(P)H-dependent oxidoreductase [Algiphilus sp. W345]MDT0496242.1 NAD(P)H-dependent oxidoreductase [Algiphilus sp. W345]
MKHLLLIYGGQPGGRNFRMLEAVRDGISEFADEVELREKPALLADIDDLLWADGLLIGTPEKFGYMSGSVKDFMDRTYYPAQDKVDALPYAIFVSAGNDGLGAVSAIERIAVGYKWKAVAQALICVGDPDEAMLGRCRELGQTLAAGIAYGAF